jgi:hypothetical protein
VSVLITNKLNGLSDSGATSYATASWTPSANTLYFASVVTRTGITADPTQPTASGNGLTWVVVASIVFDNTSSSRRRVTLFRAMGASPTTGALTFDEAGQSQTNAEWSIEEITGTDLTGTNGSGAIVQFVTNFDASGTALSLAATLAAFSSVNNATFGTFGAGSAGGATTAGSGFTKLADVVGSTSTKVCTEWKAANSTTVDFTNDTTAELCVIAVEIKAAVATTSLPPAERRYLAAVGRAGSY